MQKAIDLACENARTKQGGPYGAVVVKDGKIIGTGVTIRRSTNDPTDHAEIRAIREACQNLQTMDLSGCEIYASGEPCPMCLAAIYWTNIGIVYYAYPSDMEATSGGGYIYKQFALPKEERDIPVVQIENPDPNNNPANIWEKTIGA